MIFAAALFSLLVGSVSVEATVESEYGAEHATAPLLRGKSRGLTAPDPKGAKIDRCILVNLKTMAEHILESTDKYDYAEATTTGWSIKCFGETGKNIDYAKFFYDGDAVSEQYYSPERFDDPSEQPFWMRGDNRGDDVNPVTYLNSSGEKKITVKIYTWEGGDEFPSDKKQYVLNGGGASKCSGVVCPFNGTCDNASGACNCNSGYVLKSGACLPPSKCDGVTCPASSTCDEATGVCQCNAGLVLKDTVCVPRPKCDGVTCAANSVCEETTGTCICKPGFEFKSGVCSPIDRCGGVNCMRIHGSTCDPMTGTCVCRPKFALEHGVMCLPVCHRTRCPLGSYCSYQTGDCLCHQPNQQLINGVCRCPLVEKSAVFGTPTGTPFDQGNSIIGCPQVFQAKLQANANVIRVGVLLAHPYKWLEDGGIGGNNFGLSHFAHGEYISEVVVCKDPTAIVHLKISTSKGRTISGGTNNGDCQVFKAPMARAIVGFHGTYTQSIHSLGVVYGPVPILS